jgi:hypothetical protein
MVFMGFLLSSVIQELRSRDVLVGDRQRFAQEKPTQLEGSGCWGAQRSGIKEDAEGGGTAAELSAPTA